MAIKRSEIKAFSLVEVLVSMIILMIVTTSMLSVLTKAKPRIEETTIQGQYICYYEGNSLYEWQANNRTPNTETAKLVSDGSCKFSLTKRPAFLYALIIGAGSSKSEGQVKTEYITSIENELTIIPGKYSTTKTYSEVKGLNSNFDSLRALGGSNNTNGLLPENLKSCHLLSVGEMCPNNADEIIKNMTSCEIGMVSTPGGESLQVVYGGCSSGEAGVQATSIEIQVPGMILKLQKL